MGAGSEGTRGYKGLQGWPQRALQEEQGELNSEGLGRTRVLVAEGARGPHHRMRCTSFGAILAQPFHYFHVRFRPPDPSPCM